MNNILKPAGQAPNTFLPEDYIASKNEGRANILVLVLFALILAGVVGACIVTTRSLVAGRERNEAATIALEAEGKKIEQIKALESQRAQMMEKAEITAALVEKVPRWALLGEIGLRMPFDMRLDQVQLKSTRLDSGAPAAPKAPSAPQPLVKTLADRVKGTEKVVEAPKVTAPRFNYSLTILGTALKNNDVADYLASLKRSPILDNVEMSYIKAVKDKSHEFRKFEVTATLRPNIDTTVLSDSLRALLADQVARLEGRESEMNESAPGTNSTAGVNTEEP